MKRKFLVLGLVTGAIGLGGCGIVHDYNEYELESPSDTAEIRHYKNICVNKRNGAACYYVYEKGTYLSDEMRDKYLQAGCSLGYQKACELKLFKTLPGEREITSKEEQQKIENYLISLRKQLNKKVSPDRSMAESDIYHMFLMQILEDCGYRISSPEGTLIRKYYENGKKCNLTNLLSNPFNNRKIQYNYGGLEYTFYNYIPNTSVSVFFDHQHYKIKSHPAIKFLNEEQGTFTINLNDLKKIYKSKVDSKPFFATAEPNLYIFLKELTERL